MKTQTFAVILLSCVALFAFSIKTKNEEGAKIKWITFQEAEKLSKKNPKKIMVDVYTTWCGWCKELDRTTFADPSVIAYVNKHFYAVKFNAEGNDTILFNKQTFVNPAGSGRRGTHQLAMAIGSKDGRIGYPTVSYLDEKNQVASIVPGYLPANQFLMHLKYVNENHYKTTTIDEYMNNPSNQ